MAKDIDRKLRVTAALLGTVTLKDLGAAFRRINPATPFDIERAHKWMQGRASPGELQIYTDWARLPAANARLSTAAAYLPTQDSLAEDLIALGLGVTDPVAVDRNLGAFLARGDGLDQISISDYQPLVESLDRAWLEFPGANP